MASENRFSPSGRLMALEIGTPGKAPIVSRGYRHDGQGNVVGMTHNGSERRYRYDAMNRLTAVADAIYHATHKRFYELPITREQIAMAVEK